MENPDVSTVFFMHGTPGSRFVLSEREALGRLPNIVWIFPERPGYGLSTFQSNRTLASWAEDIDQLADFLGIDHYAIAGISGGAPHALACARYSPDRISGAFLFSSPVPRSLGTFTVGISTGNRFGLWVTRFAPWLVRASMRSDGSAFERDPEGFLTQVSAQLSESDQELMKNPRLRKEMIADLEEALRQKNTAQFVDASLAMSARSWGFDSGTVRPPVFAWHGETDALVPVEAARALAKTMPTMRLKVLKNAGHLLTDHGKFATDIAGSAS